MSSLGTFVRKSQASLFWCMRGLPKAQREAVYTLHAFGRHIESIVGGNLPNDQKKQILETWEKELDNIYVKKVPATDVGRKIYKNCMRFKIRKEDFCAMLNSALLDFSHPLQAPDRSTFDLFVKGAAEMPIFLTLQIMGEPGDENEQRLLAENFGRAMQLTLILKDIKEDAQAGHLYIPRDILKESSVLSTDPLTVLTDAHLVTARERLGTMTEDYYAKAFEKLASMRPEHTRPLRFILSIYKRYFDLMKARGWEIMSPKPEITKRDKFKIALKVLFDRV